MDINVERAQSTAVAMARQAGKLLRANLYQKKKANEVLRHDIKLELDVRCQKLIEAGLRKQFPKVAILGEEGVSGDQNSDTRWVIDPIDGTVNFSYGIPHAAVCIALQVRDHASGCYEDGFSTVVGVIYDPFADELWTALRGKRAFLNGRAVSVSQHSDLSQAVVSVGFSKMARNITSLMAYMVRLAHRVRKVRIMGSAALSMTYVASGRFDAYIERGLRLWDIAAAGLILECAGGAFEHEPIRGKYTYRMVCTNGKLGNALRPPR